MNIKKFLILSLFAIVSIASYACGVNDVVRYYIYYLPQDSETWEDRKADGMMREWSKLLGTKVEQNDINGLSWLSYSDDWSTVDNKIVRGCLKSANRDALEYLKLLVKFMSDANLSYNDWEYPSKEEIASKQRNIKDIRAKAEAYGSGRLAPQYRLMRMRCDFALQDWPAVIALWNSVPKDGTIFTEMMRNLYAGALYRTGKFVEAFAIYSDQGDNHSASWCAAKRPVVDGIEAFYNTDPNSSVLPYLIKQFCDNVQETTDVLDDLKNNKIQADYIKDYLDMIGAIQINKASADKFVNFALKAAANPAVKDAAMWLNAAALVNHYYDDDKTARSLLDMAKSGSKSVVSEKGTKYIEIFVDMALATDMAAKSARALEAAEWLAANIEADGNAISFDSDMLTRLIYDNVKPVFTENGMYNELLTLMAILDCHSPYVMEDIANIYGTPYFSLLNTMPLSKTVKWSEYLATADPSDGWNVLARKYCDGQKDFLNDLIGTRFMRQGKFDEAKIYLSSVPLSFLSKQRIAPYAAGRKFSDIPWDTGREVINPDKKVAFLRNPKIDYCDYVSMLRQKVKDNGSADDMMRLAAAYFNASEQGKCWWLTRYGSSVCPDSVVAPDFDFAIQSDRILDRILASSGSVPRLKVLYAKAFISPDDVYVYDSDWNQKINPQSRYFKAYSALASAVRNSRTPLPAYISHCDILKQFMQEN